MRPRSRLLRTLNWCMSRTGKKIKTGVKMGWSDIGRQHNIIKYNPLSLKRKMYNQYILPAITYV